MPGPLSPSIATGDSGQHQPPPDRQTERISTAGGAAWTGTRKIGKNPVSIIATPLLTRHPTDIQRGPGDWGRGIWATLPRDDCPELLLEMTVLSCFVLLGPIAMQDQDGTCMSRTAPSSFSTSPLATPLSLINCSYSTRSSLWRISSILLPPKLPTILSAIANSKTNVGHPHAQPTTAISMDAQIRPRITVWTFIPFHH